MSPQQRAFDRSVGDLHINGDTLLCRVGGRLVHLAVRPPPGGGGSEEVLNVWEEPRRAVLDMMMMMGQPRGVLVHLDPTAAAAEEAGCRSSAGHRLDYSGYLAAAEGELRDGFIGDMELLEEIGNGCRRKVYCTVDHCVDHFYRQLVGNGQFFSTQGLEYMYPNFLN